MSDTLKNLEADKLIIRHYYSKTYHIPDKKTQAQMAWKANVNNCGKEIKFILKDALGLEISEDELYKPNYRQSCLTCGNRPICNGCSNCGRCKD